MMILHVTFSEGSNPWVCFSDDRQEIAEHWREWVKNHPFEAQPKAYRGDYICEISPDRAGYLVYKQGQLNNTAKKYKYLGYALKFMEKRSQLRENNI